ncbi:IS3 family transposase [Chromohalobacter israelensis]|uniref:IS3 family transposase n=1 Tax=Chromohalobacter israelensis TaxID=141390 RepID=UPI000551E7CE|nr:IS3 family transposase [Chromohalobacter israelensis]
MAQEGQVVSLAKLCRWLGFPRRSLYYRPKARQRVVNTDLTARVKLTLERFPSYGYRRLACVLGENRKPIQRILQLKGWQVRKRPQGFRPRARRLPSITSRPDERWATDLTNVWCGKDRRASLAVIIDCCTREILGWRLSDNGSTKTAEAALEEALIYRLGALGRVQQPLALRSDNGLVFSSRHYTGTVKAYGLTQEFTTPYTPEQNGLVERFFRSLKEECIWLHRFESLGQARVVIDRWIRYYNEERPHQSLDYVAPRAHPALAA